MKKKITFALVLCMLVVSLVGCECKHNWQDADCTAPRTCTKCGETEGEPLGHRWECATFSSPQTCRVCGTEEGRPLTETKVKQALLSLRAASYEDLDRIEALIKGSYGGMTAQQRRQSIAFYVLCKDGPAFLEDQVRDVLVDPDSYKTYGMKVRSPLYYDKEKDEFYGEIQLDYGGANGFGGMARKKENFNVYFRLTVEDWETWDVFEDWGSWDAQFSRIFTWDWY